MNHPIAHVRINDEQTWIYHDLVDHLTHTASRAKRFAQAFNGGDWASTAGLWHDLGKYRPAFQQYIRNASGCDPDAHAEGLPGRVDHSAAGAIHAVTQLGLPGRVLAYLIAGHHTGLPDWSRQEGGTGASLRERLVQREQLDEALSTGIPSEILEPTPPSSPPSPGGKEGFALWVRMLFSCLVDADFLDTEAFMDPARAGQRGGQSSLGELATAFDAHMDALSTSAPDTRVNRLRAEILGHCRQAAKQPPGLFSLTVPTGGGKTLSSLAFALEHAREHSKRRIIYAIPYTSIIEQTADTFRGIFGDAVLEHHSSLDPDALDTRSRLASENWDAPLIVTTNVQFFESLFAARTSRCRKLHNIADSVVILDETQILPPAFLQPILDAMNLLARHYGVSFVLCTATQPALASHQDSFGKTILRGLDAVREIIPDTGHLAKRMKRVHIHLPEDFRQRRDWEEIASVLTRHDTVLAIVNTRRHARELHALMPPGTMHLSALMCGQHRSERIAEIKTRLAAGEPVRVVSTQLVEAGVDLDFPVVYRALAGLDAIAQAAGRCNREGRLPEKGRVVVFVPPEEAPPGPLRRAAHKTVSVLHGGVDDPLDNDLFRRFFELFYADSDLDERHINALLTPKGDGEDALRVQFRSAANRFRLIDDNAIPVLVWHDENARTLIGKLRKAGPDRWLLRKLQRYSVNLPQFTHQRLADSGEIEEIASGIWAQVVDTLYDPELGLVLEPREIATDRLVI